MDSSVVAAPATPAAQLDAAVELARRAFAQQVVQRATLRWEATQGGRTPLALNDLCASAQACELEARVDELRRELEDGRAAHAELERSNQQLEQALQEQIRLVRDQGAAV